MTSNRSPNDTRKKIVQGAFVNPLTTKHARKWRASAENKIRQGNEERAKLGLEPIQGFNEKEFSENNLRRQEFLRTVAKVRIQALLRGIPEQSLTLDDIKRLGGGSNAIAQIQSAIMGKLVIYGNLTKSEAAELLGVSEKTIGNYLEALRKIKQAGEPRPGSKRAPRMRTKKKAKSEMTEGEIKEEKIRNAIEIASWRNKQRSGQATNTIDTLTVRLLEKLQLAYIPVRNKPPRRQKRRSSGPD